MNIKFPVDPNLEFWLKTQGEFQSGVKKPEKPETEQTEQDKERDDNQDNSKHR